MSPEYQGLILMVAMITVIFIGFPIAFTLIILAIVAGYINFGDGVFYQMYYQTLGLMKESTLAAAPLFVFMGYLLQKAGLMERLFRSFQLMFAPVRGSLYLGVLVTSTLFATATGIIGASVTVMGIMAAPAMNRAGYDVRMSAGVISAGGCLGILIPPSVMLLVMGPIVGVSVLDLFAAALIPGIILAALFIGYTMIRSYINPKLGPPLPPEQRATSYKQIIVEFASGVLPLGVIMFSALGSIVLGIATPTEAAGMGALGSLLLTVAYGRLTWKVILEACRHTLTTTSFILFLAMAANIYGAVFMSLGTGTLVTDTLISLPLSPGWIIVVLMVLIFLLGWPLEWPAVIFIFLPVFVPVVSKLGFNLVWFSTLVAVNLQTAFLSPPVAMAAYYLRTVAPEWSLKDIYRGMAVFMVLQMIGLLIVFIFPATALWLPSILFGK